MCRHYDLVYGRFNSKLTLHKIFCLIEAFSKKCKLIFVNLKLLAFFAKCPCIHKCYLLCKFFDGKCLLSELLLPLIAWVIAYGGEILTWVIVIVILVAIFGGFGRGRRRWF